MATRIEALDADVNAGLAFDAIELVGAVSVSPCHHGTVHAARRVAEGTEFFRALGIGRLVERAERFGQPLRGRKAEVVAAINAAPRGVAVEFSLADADAVLRDIGVAAVAPGGALIGGAAGNREGEE